MKKVMVLAVLVCITCLSGCQTKNEVEDQTYQLEVTDMAKDLVFELGQEFDLQTMNLIEGDVLEDIVWSDYSEMTEVGKYEVVVSYQDQEVTITFEIKDTTAPEITVEDITIKEGEEVNYLDNVMTADLSEVDIQVDSEEVSVKKAGTYTVYYTVTDEYGNIAEEEGKVTVEAVASNVAASGSSNSTSNSSTSSSSNSSSGSSNSSSNSNSSGSSSSSSSNSTNDSSSSSGESNSNSSTTEPSTDTSDSSTEYDYDYGDLGILFDSAEELIEYMENPNGSFLDSVFAQLVMEGKCDGYVGFTTYDKWAVNLYFV